MSESGQLSREEQEARALPQLMERWIQVNDRLESDLAPLLSQVKAIQDKAASIGGPARDELAELEALIAKEVAKLGFTYKVSGAEARYRSGTRRITYDWRQVDAVAEVLEDVMPKAAARLGRARRESVGSPSVKVVRIREVKSG